MEDNKQPIVTPAQILDLIRSLPDSDLHIHESSNELVCVTNEWLVGSFCGRGFEDTTEEGATKRLIEYLDREALTPFTMVGKIVIDSGWPNLEKVKTYCGLKHEEDGDNEM